MLIELVFLAFERIDTRKRRFSTFFLFTNARDGFQLHSTKKNRF